MKRIGEILVANGLISTEQLEKALKEQSGAVDKKRIGEILIDMGYLTYDTLITYLEKQIDK